jgi:hypothetical protein
MAALSEAQGRIDKWLHFIEGREQQLHDEDSFEIAQDTRWSSRPSTASARKPPGMPAPTSCFTGPGGHGKLSQLQDKH